MGPTVKEQLVTTAEQILRETIGLKCRVMERTLRRSMLCALLLPLSAFGQTPQEANQPAEIGRDFCEALSRAVPGAAIKVELAGVVVSGDEARFFYDPEEPQCRLDLQPVAAVEFLPGVDFSLVHDMLKKYGQAKVELVGTLYGPLPLKPDDPKLSLAVSYVKRTQGRRYGHMDIFRTKLVVHSVAQAKPVDGKISPPLISRREELTTLRLLELTIPAYPEAARRAGIEGDVVMRLEVAGGRATAIRLINGDRLFEGAIRKAVEQWRFDSQGNGTLDSVFSFHLEQRLMGVTRDPVVEGTPPHYIRILAPEDLW